MKRPLPTGYFDDAGVYHAPKTRKKPEAEPPALEREVQIVQVAAEPTPPTEPWFTIHLGFNFAIALEWCVAVGVGAAILTIGKPDLLDALTAFVGRL